MTSMVPGVAALVLVVGCGGLASSNTHDARSDGTPPPLDASVDALVDSAAIDLTTDSAADSPVDAPTYHGDACPIVYGPPSFDGGCSDNSCSSSEYCLYSEGMYQKNFRRCVTIPDCCVAMPTCACILAIDHCFDAGCSEDGGRIILTCERPLPP